MAEILSLRYDVLFYSLEISRQESNHAFRFK